MADSCAFINLIDQIFIYFKTISKKCTNISEDYNYNRVLDLVNPRFNEHAYKRWKRFLKSYAEKEVEEFFSGDFYEPRVYDHIFESHFSEFSLKMIGYMNSIIGKYFYYRKNYNY